MTPADLSDVLVRVLRCPRERADLHAPHMLEALRFAEINTPGRLAHWLGQVGHESGRLRYVREIYGPTPQQARYEPTTSLSRALGNTRPGDGARYLGRGLIQVTGRANYRALTARLRSVVGGTVPDFEAAPMLLQGVEWASMSAADYWRSRGLNRWADAGDILTLTKRINGGTNGLADRQAITAQALSILGA
jgi:putative chitinase